MKSSDLKHIVIIERVSTHKNVAGIPVEGWNDLITARAKVDNVAGSESEKNEGTQIKIQIDVTIRFNPNFNIEYTDRIKFKCNCFNITGIDNLDNSNKWINLKGVCIK